MNIRPACSSRPKRKLVRVNVGRSGGGTHGDLLLEILLVENAKSAQVSNGRVQLWDLGAMSVISWPRRLGLSQQHLSCVHWCHTYRTGALRLQLVSQRISRDALVVFLRRTDIRTSKNK